MSNEPPLIVNGSPGLAGPNNCFTLVVSTYASSSQSIVANELGILVTGLAPHTGSYTICCKYLPVSLIRMAAHFFDMAFNQSNDLIGLLIVDERCAITIEVLTASSMGLL